ncbi:MAG TPA: nitrate/sulfonate/bicarbonate ABC transporter ATP-binding protein [Stellaceae bacterium]|nr:nitrate/sulfonate/bicarbonate ABC transporter ATP-binding protein [Stellaceae bacterium]
MPDDSRLISAEKVCKTYQTAETPGRLVLDHVDFALRAGEIVAILGKSGSGKSTFLRVLAGLTAPTEGHVAYRGQTVDGPAVGIAMVFQTFALFPWLTVLGNVELGLEAQGVPRAERRRRALQAIDLIGLDGFESAYPKELSGGMRQRVGFARALVVNPDVLLLDEPFSALDVLTAETLRNDLMDLWLERRVPTKGIILVSHNIEEAVEVADRIIIFGSDPGHIRAEIPVLLPRPREVTGPRFRQIVDEVYTLLTTTPGQGAGGKRGTRAETIGIGYRLPKASIQQLVALLDAIVEPPYSGRADLPYLAEHEHVDDEQLFVLIEALQLLSFARVEGGDIWTTPIGRAFAEADLQERKRIFSEQLLRTVPLAAHIRKVLDERPWHSAPEGRFLAELEDYLSEEEAREVFDIVINWGRYAELFAYDYDRGVLSLENPT